MLVTPVRMVERRRTLDAVLVTADNLAEVAHWCGGHVISDGSGPVAVGVPVGRSVLSAVPGGYVICRHGADGVPHFQPVPEQELLFGWAPA